MITGAGGGIGRALAQAFAASGSHVALGDIDARALDDTAALLPSRRRVTTHRVDVASAESMARFRREVVSQHTEAHVLVNNAGVTVYGPFLDHSAADLERIIGVNLWGVVHGCREFAPLFRDQRVGHIVNMSSLAGYVGIPFQSMYCATKAAVKGLSEALRAELAPFSVGVTSVHPGAVRTNLLGTASTHDEAMSRRMAELMLRYALPPETAARRIVRAVRRNRGELRMCAESHATHLALRLFPGLVRWSLDRAVPFGYRSLDEARNPR